MLFDHISVVIIVDIEVMFLCENEYRGKMTHNTLFIKRK